MGNFKSLQLISKSDAVITGSLNVLGAINSNVFGTASLVATSSYSLTSGVAAYTTVLSTLTASYSAYSVTSSYAMTSSFVSGPYYAPTSIIGYLSPNVYFGTPDQFQNLLATQTGGVHYSPILITKTCTVTTMSAVIITAAAGPSIIRYAIYSHSTISELPQYLLTQCSASVPQIGSTVISASIATPLQLLADNIYWVAFAPSSLVRIPSGQSAASFGAYNPLLQQRYTVGGNYLTQGAGVSPPYSGATMIRSGSTFGLTFVPTASQTLSEYSPYLGSTPLSPFLRITY